MLEKRAAGAVHHALWETGRPRRIHDVRRVVERKTLEVQRFWFSRFGGGSGADPASVVCRSPARHIWERNSTRWSAPVSLGRGRLVAFRRGALAGGFRPLRVDKSRPQRSFAHALEIRHLLPVRRDDDVLKSRYSESDLPQSRQKVDLFAVVQISVGGEQHLRLDLPEAIHDTLCAEVGRAG